MANQLYLDITDFSIVTEVIASIRANLLSPYRKLCPIAALVEKKALFGTVLITAAQSLEGRGK